MKFIIKELGREKFLPLSEDAFKASFGEYRPSHIERFDFALIAIDPRVDKIAGFITAKEMDSKTLYFQFGGTFKEYEKTISVYHGYKAFLSWAHDRYDRVTTRIENNNISMLKMALKAGFLINGTYTFGGKIYLELINEFGG